MEYNSPTVRRMIVSTMLVHNFLIDYEQGKYVVTVPAADNDNANCILPRCGSSTAQVSAWRDSIAQKMWLE